MGCGKTLTAIAILGAGYLSGHIRRVLIAAPASVCAVWARELEECANFPFTVRVLLGTKISRLNALDELCNLSETCLKVAIINYESVWRREIYDKLCLFHADCVIADESQRIKSPRANQSRAMHRLGDRAKYRLILTGTPVQNAGIDLYSQYRFLDKSVFGTRIADFRKHYCIMGGFQNKQITGYHNMPELIRKEHSIACRVTKEEALDLPEQTFINYSVTLSPASRKIYDQLRLTSVAELEHSETVTAATVLTRLLRLLQLTGGFLPSDEGRPQQVSSAKLDALGDIIQDCVIDGQKKLLVFAKFRAEIFAIQKLCDKLLRPCQSVCVLGDTPKRSRADLIQAFQSDPENKIIIGQIDTLGTGVTLTAADTCVYYSFDCNYGTYEQSLARIHRIGQKYPCTYIHLLCKNTIDEIILETLHRKENLAAGIVDNWKKYFS